MANKLNLALVIGGAIASSLGSTFKTVTDGITKLEQKGNKAKVLKSTIGETIKLREEWKKAHDTGSAAAAGLLRKLDSNLDALRKQGVQVGRLDREYQRLGKTAKAVDLQVKGRQQITAGKEGLKSTAGMATAAVAAVTIPTVISANYQDKVRDIAIKAGVANQPEEKTMSDRIIQVAQDNGTSRDGVADIVNQLVGAGMDLNKALSYADVAAKFSVGQGASGEDTARMIMSLEQNAKISDPAQMTKALEGIALQGQAGSFEAADMARWFPVLLAGMEKTGSVGPEAVAQLGAMLQVQMKTAGGSDEAANNLKNWIEKVGSGEVVDAYKKAGIDYQESLNTGIQKGMSVLESSMALAMQYVEKTDPAKAKKMAQARAAIDKEVDPAKALKMLNALEQSLRTGDIFADMQVKAALTAYGQNRGLYEQLKKDATEATGILEKNLAERRETSKQKWAETAYAIDDAMRSIGDAIRPFTDWAATGVTSLAQGFTKLSGEAQSVIAGIMAVAGGLLALKGVVDTFKIGKGLIDLGSGKALERMADRAGKGAEPAAPATRKPGLLDRVRGKTNVPSAPAGEPALKVGDTQKVWVVNADALGRGAGSADDAPGGRKRPKRRPGRPVRPSRSKPPSRPPARLKPEMPTPKLPEVPKVPAAVAGSRMGEMIKAARGATTVGKRVPGLNLLDAGMGAADVAMNATTQDEKAEGYGGVAGGAAGTAAGAWAGAAIGTLIFPGVGTAIGGLIGGVLGGMAGEEGGAVLGKAMFGEKKAEEVAKVDEPPPSAAPAVSYDPLDPNSKDPFLVPALTANKVRFPGAAPVAPAVVAKAPEPVVPAAPAVSYDPLDPNSKDPFLVPALTANRVRFPGAGLTAPQAPAMGDVVRDLSSTAAAAPSVPDLAKVAATKPEPPKVDQTFTFAPSMPVTVQGDVKDAGALARELSPHLKTMFEDYARQAQARQLSDAPHA